jgi:hypothetical protein
MIPRDITIGRSRAASLGLAAVVALCAPRSAACVAVTEANEARLKAAFIYNFAAFTEWPSEARGAAGNPVVLGVLGDDELLDAMAETLRTKVLAGRPVIVRGLVDVEDAHGCHVVYVGRRGGVDLAPTLEHLAGEHVLTVGDGVPFLRAGGVVCFTVQEDTLRFQVDMEAARRARLKLSSQLLRLAIVHRDVVREAGRP